MLGAESRQSWERWHLRVEAEGELVGGRPAGGGDLAMMCALEPSLETTDDSMHPGQAAKLLPRVMLSLGGMAIAHASERCVGFSAVYHVRAHGFPICGDEGREGWRGSAVARRVPSSPRLRYFLSAWMMAASSPSRYSN
jgi:hypothetical protein